MTRIVWQVFDDGRPDELVRGVVRVREREVEQLYVYSQNCEQDGKKNVLLGSRVIEGKFRTEEYNGPMFHKEMLEGLIKKYYWTRGAEIGVREGTMTFHLVSNCPKLELVAADFWPGEFDASGKQFKETLRNHPHQDRILLFQKPSVEAAKEIGDGSLDFVFIDADHSYESCLEDIRAWAPKVKHGGLVSGHDINWDPIRRAVEEYFGTYDEWSLDNCWLVWK